MMNRNFLFCTKGICLAAATIAIPFQTFSQTTNTTALPEVIVSGKSELREEAPIGANQQPEWTTQRRFATTRVYVLEPWQVEFEQWWKGKFNRDASHDHLFQSEIEMGLPYHFQLDLYENIQHPPGGPLSHQGNQVEMRYALADWGKIPLNPTLYGEWKFNADEADAFEVKLLLGNELAPHWHWGFNLFYEQQVGGDRESEIGFAQGVSYTLIDEKLGVGLEMNLERTSHRNFDGLPATEFLIGPSVQWRPMSRMHLNFVPLIGATHDAPRVEAYVIFGFDFWKPKPENEGYVPVSTMSK